MRGREWSWVDGTFFAVTAIYFYSLVPYGLNLDDEGTLLYQIYRTALGHRLYTDFHAGYTPGVYLWNAFLFRAFDVNVLYLRFALTIVNSLAVYLIYTVAQRIGATKWAAALCAWSYVALIPFYDGQFFSANIPYPIWYVTLLWLAGTRCIIGWWQAPSSWWLLAVGAVAGAVFTFKPNSGVLAAGGYLASMAALTTVELPENSSRSWAAKVTDWFRRLVPWVLVGGVLVMMRGAATSREVAAIALPVAAVAAASFLLPVTVCHRVAPRGAWGMAAAFGAGFLGVVAPWVVHYWREMGTQRFLRATLFVGTDFERFYFIGYPGISSFGWLLVGALGGLVALVWLLRVRLLSSGILGVGFTIAAVAGALLLWLRPPPMVEGFSASVAMRLRDVSFALALAAIWGGVAWWLAKSLRLRRVLRTLPPEACGPLRALRILPVTLVVLYSAVMMHAQLYPRTDFMHLVPAVPALLVLSALLLTRWSMRFGVVLCRDVRAGRWAARAMLVPIASIIIAVTAPAWGRAAYLWVHGWRGSEGVVRLQSGRAPLVVEPAAGRLFVALSELTRFLSARTSPGEFIFTFPVLDVVSFLADRHNPTRHGYFFPGWPGHEVEAEVIDSLRQRPPRFVVTLHDHPLFFASAPAYYFNLRRYITANYQWIRRVGMFDVLGTGDDAEPLQETDVVSDRTLWLQELAYRRGAVAAELRRVLNGVETDEPGVLARALAAASPAARESAAWLIRKSRSAYGAAALATMLELQELPARVEELAVRIVAEVGTAECAAPLLRWMEVMPARRATVAGLLFHISSKLGFESYWFSRAWQEAEARLDGVEWEQLAQWADNPWELLALRLFAVRAIGHARSSAVVPVLIRLLGDRGEWRDLASQAAQSLAALGWVEPVLPAVVRLLRDDKLWAPAIVAQQWRASDPTARVALEVEMSSELAHVRTTAFWIAAGVRDTALQPALEAGLSDSVPEVRMAAAWGLGELGNPSAEAVLRRHLDDPDDRVATFVRGALAKLGVWLPA